MKYCGAIRKCFDSNNLKAGISREDAMRIAVSVGYKAMVFNGVVYVHVDDEQFLVSTPFSIEDFEV